MSGLPLLTILRSREIKKVAFSENMFLHILFYFKINIVSGTELGKLEADIAVLVEKIMKG